MPITKIFTFRLAALFFVLVFFALWVMGTYNGLVRSREVLDTSWAQVETQYQRRFDLVPNLQATVQGAANFERNTFKEITTARTQWQTSQTQNDQMRAINTFDTALSRLLVTVEAYPDLKATKAFTDFMVQLEGTENRISVARRDFNQQVRNYNILIKTFPRNLIAGMLGFEPAAFFQSNEQANEPPIVKFK